MKLKRESNILKEKLRKQNGITLIVLVVTIIILIILATISINIVFLENGLIQKAKESKQHQANAVLSDQTELDKAAEEAANIIAGGNGAGGELQEITPDTPVGTVVKKPEATIPEDKWSEKVTAISDGSGNAIPLPNGFYYVGGSRTEGLVISDNTADKNKGTSYETASTLVGNQFVWIPVDNEETLTRTQFDSTTGQPTAGLDTVKYTEPYIENYTGGKATEEMKSFDIMKTQVLKYGGFYIGRYEAGDAESGTTLKTKVIAPHTVVVKKGVAPYNYIPWGMSMTDADSIFEPGTNNPDKVETYGAVYLSKHLYDGKEQSESIVSTLCYGSQWDAMCRYIGDAQRNSIKKSTAELTGNTEEDVSKNIYDLAGNCEEWTMEAYNDTKRILRGGYYYYSYSVKNRDNNVILRQCHQADGFRPTLYIK